MITFKDDKDAAAAEARGDKFFTSVIRDDGKYRLLSGPFDTWSAAMEDLDRVKKLANDLDPQAYWYGYGTASMPAENAKSAKVFFPLVPMPTYGSALALANAE